ncbi:MAG: hypothetical protein AB7I42_24095 [Bradyrhizobium sp.]|uniref:DUF7694 domain-containing protein n=1 Tax=Bradyrhizobium sp. TaxID=376 RepID=UPI003D11B15C
MKPIGEISRLVRTVLNGKVPREGLDGIAFTIPVPGGQIRVIASNGGGWDHVSVSLSDRTPTWNEMELVKRSCFKDDETAVQFHVPPGIHKNVHEHCLNIWRDQSTPYRLPPIEYV